jgi:hypothetical protein
MSLLAAAISPGFLGFSDWVCAAEVPSEIAAKTPIATRKNNAFAIIFPSHSSVLADAVSLFGLFSQLGQIKATDHRPALSHRWPAAVNFRPPMVAIMCPSYRARGDGRER